MVCVLSLHDGRIQWAMAKRVSRTDFGATVVRMMHFGCVVPTGRRCDALRTFIVCHADPALALDPVGFPQCSMEYATMYRMPGFVTISPHTTPAMDCQQFHRATTDPLSQTCCCCLARHRNPAHGQARPSCHRFDRAWNSSPPRPQRTCHLQDLLLAPCTSRSA